MAKDKTEDKRPEKIGDWFLDIAKYLLTAVIISTMFSEVENKWWIIGISAALVVICIIVGMHYLKPKK